MLVAVVLHFTGGAVIGDHLDFIDVDHFELPISLEIKDGCTGGARFILHWCFPQNRSIRIQGQIVFPPATTISTSPSLSRSAMAGVDKILAPDMI